MNKKILFWYYSGYTIIFCFAVNMKLYKLLINIYFLICMIGTYLRSDDTVHKSLNKQSWTRHKQKLGVANNFVLHKHATNWKQTLNSQNYFIVSTGYSYQLFLIAILFLVLFTFWKVVKIIELWISKCLIRI